MDIAGQDRDATLNETLNDKASVEVLAYRDTFTEPMSLPAIARFLGIIGGNLPARERRLVEAWAEIHQAELLEDWERLQLGRPPSKIEPLR